MVGTGVSVLRLCTGSEAVDKLGTESSVTTLCVASELVDGDEDSVEVANTPVWTSLSIAELVVDTRLSVVVLRTGSSVDEGNSSEVETRLG